MQLPLVSVVIPTRNRSHLLREALQSVFKQTFQDIEIIVVDDASTDDTQSVVQELSNDERVRYIKHCARRGGAIARNTGIHLSRGRYIALLDDDDIWLISDKLEKQIAVFEKGPPEIGVVYGGYHELDIKSGRIIRTMVPKKRGDIHRDIMWKNWIGTSTVLIRKECFECCGLFDEKLPSAQDRDLWIRISRRFYFDYIEDICAIYRLHPVRISTNIHARIIGREYMLNKHYDELRYMPKVLARWYIALGHMYFAAGSKVDALRYFKQAIHACPTYPTAAIWWLATRCGLYQLLRRVRLSINIR
ncbi:MAG: glycosyltransferase [Candidatus Methanomethyliaceae archaeon]